MRIAKSETVVLPGAHAPGRQKPSALKPAPDQGSSQPGLFSTQEDANPPHPSASEIDTPTVDTEDQSSFECEGDL